MKKTVFAIFLVLFIFFIAPKAIADTIIPLDNGKAVYYSPAANIWSTGMPSQESITLIKKGKNYFSDNKLIFSLKTDYNILVNQQLVAVNNNTLKFYSVKYTDEHFRTFEMTPDEVQDLFKDIKVLPVSDFKSGVTTIQRTPFGIDTVMLVNDTNQDFTNYTFSPTSIHRTDIKGVFLARKVGTVKFVKIGDTQRAQPHLVIKIRNDYEKYPTHFERVTPRY